MLKAKYIKTRDMRMIVFSCALKHSDFKHFNPVSAGFVNFFSDGDGQPSYSCYGRSESLDLSSQDEDTQLAKLQIINQY